MSLLPFLWLVKESPNMVTTSQELPAVGIQKKRGEYQKLSPEDKAAIGKYASEHKVTRTMRKFKEKI